MSEASVILEEGATVALEEDEEEENREGRANMRGMVGVKTSHPPSSSQPNKVCTFPLRNLFIFRFFIKCDNYK